MESSWAVDRDRETDAKNKSVDGPLKHKERDRGREMQREREREKEREGEREKKKRRERENTKRERESTRPNFTPQNISYLLAQFCISLSATPLSLLDWNII
jgi:hypothetical protein